MVVALPFAAASWFAFDDTDQIRKDWAVRLYFIIKSTFFNRKSGFFNR